MLYFIDIDDQSCMLTRYVVDKEKSNIKIPDRNLENKKIKYIAAGAFSENQTIGYIITGRFVEEIGRYAFSNDMRLLAFECLNVKRIRKNAYSNCYKMKYFHPGNKLEEVQDYAFSSNIALEEFISPKSLVTFGEFVFVDCESLKVFKFSPGIKYIPKGLLKKCVSITSIYIPDKVEKIDSYVFAEDESLAEVRFGKRVKSVGAYCLYKTAVRKVSFENSITHVGKYILKCCHFLEKVSFGPNVISIGQGFVDYCELLDTISVASTNKRYSSVNGVLFNKNGKRLIRYPEGKKLAKYNVPDGTETLCEKALFNNQYIRRVNMAKSVNKIEKGCFKNCSSLESADLNEGITVIEEETFKNTALKGKIVLSNSVVEIKAHAYDNCIGITEIVISCFCEKIDDTAFKGCPNIIIRAVKGSYAEKYAEKNNITFLEI